MTRVTGCRRSSGRPTDACIRLAARRERGRWFCLASARRVGFCAARAVLPPGKLSADVTRRGTPKLDTSTPTPTPRGSGCLPAIAAVLVAVFVTVWWGFVGVGTENFGSDCLFYFGETGPRAEHCQRVNDRAGAWLPRLVAAAWTGSVLSLLMRRRFPLWRQVAVISTGSCAAVAVVLGVHALAVSTR